MNNIVLIVITRLIFIIYGERLMGVFYDKRRSSLPIMFLTFVIVFTLMTLALFIFNHLMPAQHILFILDMLSILASFYIISLNYKSSIARRFVAVITAYAILALSSLTMSIVISIFVMRNFIPAEEFEMTYVFYDTLELSGILIFLLTPTIALLVAILLRSFKNIRKNVAVKPALIIAIVMVLLAIIINISFILLAQTGTVDSIAPYLLVYAFVTPIGFIVLFFFLFDTLTKRHEDNIKSALNAQEREYYFTQCQLMQESVDNIKSIRHDMKLHLATTKDFISSDKTGEATTYLNSLLGYIEEGSVYSNTHNTAFDSVINFKLNNAKQENIKLDIRLSIPPALNIEVADIVTIIGNLLDNALDAVSKVEDKKIKLDIEYSRESLFIQIENTFDGVVVYDSDQKNISTRKIGGEHGHGLKNIRKSVEKYNGHMDVTHDGNIFSVTVLLYEAVKMRSK